MPEHQVELDAIKQLAARLIPVHPFKRERKTFIFTDASVDGLGMVLMQQDPNNDTLLFIFASSTGIKDSQKCYSTYELEILSIQWGLNKIRCYLFGSQPITIYTDHLAFTGLEQRELDPYTSYRTQRTIEDILSYNFTIKHIPKS